MDVVSTSISKSKSDGEIEVYIKKTDDNKKVTINYQNLDYSSQEWKNFFKDAFNGKTLSEKEFNDKFKPTIFTFVAK